MLLLFIRPGPPSSELPYPCHPMTSHCQAEWRTRRQSQARDPVGVSNNLVLLRLCWLISA
jgi:hypothetical protein